MAENNTKLYMEMQMDELKTSLNAGEDDSSPENDITKQKDKPVRKNNKNVNADVAKLYEDAAEYEEELQCFEDELEIINAHKIKDIAEALSKQLPDESRDYSEELRAVLIAAWTYFIETEKTHPLEQLDLIKKTSLNDIVEVLGNAYPDYDFEAKIKDTLIKRWETLIEIKKEHIAQEIEEIYIAGLKPSFVKRIYKQFHGIS